MTFAKLLEAVKARPMNARISAVMVAPDVWESMRLQVPFVRGCSHVAHGIEIFVGKSLARGVIVPLDSRGNPIAVPR